MMAFFESLWVLTLDLAPWLLLGLVMAGVIKAVVPMSAVARWLGKRGPMSSVWAALVGAPLPLCSCSVMPVAVGLRRQGASRGATGSFLVSTPQNGVDSIAVSYALLGPFLTIVRPIAGVISAALVGWLIDAVPEKAQQAEKRVALPVGETGPDGSCCGGGGKAVEAAPPKPCCGSEKPVEAEASWGPGWVRRLGDGLVFAFTTLLGDLLLWLVLGLLAAAAVDAFVPKDLLAQYGGGLPAMVAALVIGIPMYICATSSTPLAAALLLAGVSPGVVVVFLLAGPATNLGTFGIVRREIGNRAAWLFVVGMSVVAVALGWGTDLVASALGIVSAAQVEASHSMLPMWIGVGSLAVLGGATAVILTRRFKAKLSTPAAEPSPQAA